MYDLVRVHERALGAYLGLALGDALGATVEFMTPREIVHKHGVHTEIVGGGWLDLPRGAVTDDTEMALALGASILLKEGFDVYAAADAFVAWLKRGPVDCGHTCRRGIRRYMLQGSVHAEQNEGHGGNGAAMRNLPVVLATLGHPEAMRAHSIAQAHITHHHPQSDAAVLTLGAMTSALILGAPLSEVKALADALVEEHRAFAYEDYRGPASPYIVDTVCTVLRFFFAAHDFESALIPTVNRGDDADTTGALVGMLAGARFGRAALPPRWLAALDPDVQTAISRQTTALLSLSPAYSMEGKRPSR
ncbi:MAG TPA: ADP-ribosyl-[dinitrogen reductase] hydrolase [Polyangiales bacterium]